MIFLDCNGLNYNFKGRPVDSLSLFYSGWGLIIGQLTLIYSSVNPPKNPLSYFLNLSSEVLSF